MYKIYRKNNYLIIDNSIDISEKYLAKDILVQEIVENVSYEIFGILPKLGNNINQLLHSVSIPNILKEDGLPYTTTEWVDFYTVNTGFFFELTNEEVDPGSIPLDRFVNSYSDLPDPTTTQYQIWVCKNSEGNRWLPGSLGGTYYPEGGYVSDGVKWIYHKDNYQASQLEVNEGIVNNKWVSPLTLENTSKWDTKQSTLVSGTNIKTINGNSLLDSGDIVITNITNLTASQTATNFTINSDTGTDAIVPLGNGIIAGATINDYTTVEKNKLSGIADGATVNSSDSILLNRINHTGTQLSSTISDIQTAITNNAAVLANTAKVTNATHIGEVTGNTTLTIATNIVTNAKLAQMGANTFKANNTGLTANALDITPTQAKTLLAITNVDVSGLGTLATQSGTFSGISSGTNTGDETTATIKSKLGITVISGINTGDQDLSGLLVKSNNLSDLTNTITARTNLGLGSLSTQSGIFSGTSSGTNTGDNAVNTNYIDDYRASNFIAGTNYLTPTGSAAALTSFPILNQNTTGTATTITGNITESQVTNLTTDLASKQNNISLTTTGTSGPATFIGTTLNIPNYTTGGGGGGITFEEVMRLKVIFNNL
jgi:hypothetical protein